MISTLCPIARADALAIGRAVNRDVFIPREVAEGALAFIEGMILLAGESVDAELVALQHHLAEQLRVHALVCPVEEAEGLGLSAESGIGGVA